MQSAGGAGEPPFTAVWLRARDRLGYARLLSLAAVAPELAQLLRRPDFWAGFRCPQLDLQTPAQARAFLVVAGDAWSSARVHLNELQLGREGLEALASCRRSFAGVTVERFLCTEGEPSSPNKYYKIILTAEQLACLADTFPRLLQLDLSGFREVDEGDLEPLSRFTQLQRLKLARLGYLELKPLAALRQLRQLNLAECPELTDTELQRLEQLKLLQELDLSDCPLLTGTGLVHVPKQRLEELSLTRCYGITDAGLESLERSSALRCLNLTDCQRITDGGLAHLQTLTKLERLSLAGCSELTDAGLLHLAGLTNLKHLDLARCRQLTGEGLLRAGLDLLPKLGSLDLSGLWDRALHENELACLHGTQGASSSPQNGKGQDPPLPTTPSWLVCDPRWLLELNPEQPKGGEFGIAPARTRATAAIRAPARIEEAGTGKRREGGGPSVARPSSPHGSGRRGHDGERDFDQFWMDSRAVRSFVRRYGSHDAVAAVGVASLCVRDGGLVCRLAGPAESWQPACERCFTRRGRVRAADAGGEAERPARLCQRHARRRSRQRHQKRGRADEVAGSQSPKRRRHDDDGYSPTASSLPSPAVQLWLQRLASAEPFVEQKPGVNLLQHYGTAFKAVEGCQLVFKEWRGGQASADRPACENCYLQENLATVATVRQDREWPTLCARHGSVVSSAGLQGEKQRNVQEEAKQPTKKGRLPQPSAMAPEQALAHSQGGRNYQLRVSVGGALFSRASKPPHGWTYWTPACTSCWQNEGTVVRGLHWTEDGLAPDGSSFATGTPGRGAAMRLEQANSGWRIQHKHFVNGADVPRGSEARVPGTKLLLDGYDEARNCVYEFHGNAYHGFPPGHPKYTEGRSSLHGRLNRDLYRETMARMYFIRQKMPAGCRMFYAWEHEYARIKDKPLASAASILHELPPGEDYADDCSDADSEEE
eukprot:g28177.t1